MNRKIAFIALVCLCIGIGLVNIFLVPPFMNPDEIQHFLFSAHYAYAVNPVLLKDLEIKVLQLLKDYQWFHFIGVGPGWEKISNLKDVFFLNNFTIDKYTISKSYFHFIYGKILRLTGISDPLTAFYFLRVLSFLMYLAICFLSYNFYRGYFPGHWYYLMAGQLLIYQLGNILNSLNYDVLLTLLGVLFFIIAYRFMINRENQYKSIILMLITAAFASLVKTGGVLFFLYFFILLIFKYDLNRQMLKRILLGLFLFVIIFSWFNYWFPGRFFKLYNIIVLKFGSLTGTTTPILGEGNIGFFDSIIYSFYFYTGWMGFRLPEAWYWLLKFFLLISFIGIIIMVIKKNTSVPGDEIPSSRSPLSARKRWLIYSLVIIIVQLIAMRFYYGSGLMSQGRYLYPLLVPIILFIYNGLKSVERTLKFNRQYILTSYLLYLVLFFIAALSRVIEVFYLEIASPHVGL
ncbi:MAG: hypothetical protein MUF15_06275 [Acidobacteria bacterium]|nr:hypothetical protein [Acidobacteriota bacterium]